MDNLLMSELDEFTLNLYESFETGFDFEEFIKLLLVKMGLDDVTVTRRTKDGGIDVTALRLGVAGLSSVDEIRYVVQAKRILPKKSVKFVDIRALRGVMAESSKGIFVTTGLFTRDQKAFAEADKARPILLLDGRELVKLCIFHGLGFKSQPVFDPSKLHRQLNPEPSGILTHISSTVCAGDLRVMRTITSNDIRARILRVPSEIATEMDIADGRLFVTFPQISEKKDYAYRSDARFIAGITNILRKSGLLLESGEQVPKISEWVLNRQNRELNVYIRQAV